MVSGDFLEATSPASSRAGILLGPLTHVLGRVAHQLMAAIRNGDSGGVSLGTSTQRGFSVQFALAVLGLRCWQMFDKVALAHVL